MPKRLLFHVHPAFRLACFSDIEGSKFEVIDHSSTIFTQDLITPALISWIRAVVIEHGDKAEFLSFHIHADDFLIIPNGSLESDALFDQLFTESEAAEILKDPIKEELIIHYKVNKELFDSINSMGVNHSLKFHFLGSSLIELSKQHEQATLIAGIHGQYLSVAFSDHNQFHYYNQFKFKDEQELLYFVILAFKELNLDTDKDALVVYGMIEESGSLFQLLYQYVRNISIAESNENYDLSYDQSMLSPHYFEPILIDRA